MTFETTVSSYIDNQLPTYRKQLAELVSIPSISSSPKHVDDVAKVAQKAAQIAQEYGFLTKICKTSGHPVLLAHLEINPNAEWITIYNHLDVQPAEEKAWKSDPFNPIITHDKIVGRGSTDDKGPMLAALHAVNFLHTTKQLPVNVQLMYETEEEMGSTHFGEFLDKYKSDIKIPSSILVSDTIFEGDHPAITYKTRGLLYTYLRMKMGSTPVHSGTLGGLAVNPLLAISQAVSKCMVDNKVLIPHFYDDIAEPTLKENEYLKKVAKVFDFEKLKNDTGVSYFNTDDPNTALRSVWHRPTFDIHGVLGGYMEPGKKTVIGNEAEFKVSMRLVPNQDPSKIFTAFKNYINYLDDRIEVIQAAGTPAFMTSIENIYMKKAAQACKFGFGKDALYVGSGGTIGSLPQFKRVFPDVPVVLLALSLMSDGYHAPNEEFRFSQASEGIKTLAKYMNSLG